MTDEEKLDGSSTTSSGDSRSGAGMVHAEGGEDHERSSWESGQIRSFDEQVTESTDANADSERGHSLLRAAISRGLIKGDRPERNGEKRSQVTKTTIFAAALLSVSIVLIGIAVILTVLPFVFNQIIGEPFTYTNIPFPVCDPTIQYNSDQDCVKVSSDYVWHPGQIVPVLIARCYSNPLSNTDEITYTFKRRLVNDTDGTQIPIDDSFTSVKKGCNTLRNSLNTIPEKAYNGTWHFEGVSQISTFRTDEVAWRSVSFIVGP